MTSPDKREPRYPLEEMVIFVLTCVSALTGLMRKDSWGATANNMRRTFFHD